MLWLALVLFAVGSVEMAAFVAIMGAALWIAERV